jgi:hypothetical protein
MNLEAPLWGRLYCLPKAGFPAQSTKLFSEATITTMQPDYLSYLLRLWRVDGDNAAQPTANQAVWRASLENPHTGERKGFASLDDLFDFLREQAGATSHCDTFQVIDKQKEN